MATAAVDPCPNEALRSGPSAQLPDCRAYELVSPLDKNGGDIQALTPIAGGLYASYKQSSAAGDKVTYTSSTAFGDAIAGVWSNQYMSTRSASGWSTHGISQPLGTALFEGKGTLPVINWDTESLFETFTSDLCSAWVRDTNVIPLAADGLVGYVNLYRRSNCGVEGYEALSREGPGNASPYLNGSGEWSSEAVGDIEATGPGLRFQGASSDLSHQVFISGAPLLPEEIGFEAKCESPVKAEVISYRWLRNGVPIEGATSPSYTIALADAGTAIQCQVTATNANGGSTQVATKARIVAPAPSTPVPVAAPIAAPCDLSLPRCTQTTSALKVGSAGGQTLTCDPNAENWRYSPTFSYRWYRNGIEIIGATAPTYTVTAADLATPAAFQCAVTGTNAGGSVVKVSESRTTTGAPNVPLVDVSMNKTRLYDLHEGQLEVVSILPSGKVNSENSVAGMLGEPSVTRESLLDHAVSEDGSRIFWTSRSGSSASGPGQIYVRIDGKESLAVSKEAEELSGKDKSLFWTAASDGSAVLFSTAEFGNKNLAFDADLYEFDVESRQTRRIARGSPGVLGASDDLSRIYFVSTEALAAGAVDGQWNLYLEEEGSTEKGQIRLVAVLSPDDKEVHVSGGVSPIWPAPIARASRVTPDGGQIAFQSVSNLTGYDNTDSAGKRYTEVFHYDASSDELTCVSCNPNGKPGGGLPIRTPYNVFDKPLNVGKFFADQFAEAATLPTWEREFYPSRALTDDGARVFFHSQEALVHGDTNGVKDVYQWESQGTGGCVAVGGCVDLISTGTSAQKSDFVDASISGNDVFFSTTSSIHPHDAGAVDIYDARVGGGLPVPPSVPDCAGDACQPVPAPPNRGTPGTTIFRGPGSSPRSCKALARRAARLRRQARRSDSPKLDRLARKVGKRLRRCRRANRGGAR